MDDNDKNMIIAAMYISSGFILSELSNNIITPILLFILSGLHLLIYILNRR